MDHASAIADPDVRSLYRYEWQRRFDALVRPERATRGRAGFTSRPEWKKNRDGRFVPPPPPVGSAARGLGSAGVDPATARALVLGHALYPQAIADHLEPFATLPLADPGLARLRDRMVDAAMADPALDRAALAPILAAEETAAIWRAVSCGDELGFSFTRTRNDPDAARRDLGLALEAVVARAEIEAALAEATRRLERDMDEAAFAEQQQLIAARQDYNQRLASLAGNE